MTLTEPMTVLTDCVLAGLTGSFAFRLFGETRKRPARPVQLWAGAFVTSSIAALLGGAYHGFQLMLGDGSRVLLWKATVFSIGFTSFFLLAASVVATLPSRLVPWIVGALAAKLLVYLAWMAGHDAFRYVIYDYGSAMLAVLALQAGAAWARPTPSAPWIAAGIFASFLGAAVQQSGLTLHRHFNHNDLYHAIQMGAVWLLYRGGRLLGAGAARPARASC